MGEGKEISLKADFNFNVTMRCLCTDRAFGKATRITKSLAVMEFILFSSETPQSPDMTLLAYDWVTCTPGRYFKMINI